MKHSFLGRYYQQDFLNPRLMIPNNIHSQRRGLSAYTKNATAGYTFIPGATLVADTHFTMSREVGDRTMDFPVTIADLGVKVNPSSNEIDLQINPVILGSGERLFDGFEAGKPALELVRVLGAPGVAHLRYRVIR